MTLFTHKYTQFLFFSFIFSSLLIGFSINTQAHKFAQSLRDTPSLTLSPCLSSYARNTRTLEHTRTRTSTPKTNTTNRYVCIPIEFNLPDLLSSEAPSVSMPIRIQMNRSMFVDIDDSFAYQQLFQCFRPVHLCGKFNENKSKQNKYQDHHHHWQ